MNPHWIFRTGYRQPRTGVDILIFYIVSASLIHLCFIPLFYCGCSLNCLKHSLSWRFGKTENCLFFDEAHLLFEDIPKVLLQNRTGSTVNTLKRCWYILHYSKSGRFAPKCFRSIGKQNPARFESLHSFRAEENQGCGRRIQTKSQIQDRGSNIDPCHRRGVNIMP